MNKYIDADKIICHLKDEMDYGMGDIDIHPVQYGTYLGLRYAKSLVETAETADVQEVVRCKDCKYSCEEKPVFGITDYSCIKLGIHCLDANDFCSYGAKMGEGVEDERG